MAKFYAKTEQVKKISQMVSRFVVSRTPAPDYQVVHVFVKSGEISFFAINPRHSYCIARISSTKCDEDFSFKVSGALFKSAIDSVRGEDMAVSLVEDGASTQILIGFADGKMKLPTATSSVSMEFDRPSQVLLEAVSVPVLDKAMSVAKAVERASVGTCGMAWIGGKACVLGTDSTQTKGVTRLAVAEVCESAEFPVFYFTPEDMSASLGCCPDDPAVAKFLVSESRVMLLAAGAGISVETGFAKETAGTFPVKQFLAMVPHQSVEANASEFFAACKQVSVVKLEESVTVAAEFHGSEILLLMKNSAGESFARVKSSGEDLQPIRINIETMTSVARCFSAGEKVRIGVSARIPGDPPERIVLMKPGVTIVSSGME